MRKNLILFSLLLASFTGMSQVKWLNPQPSGYTNTKIYFINESTGYLMNTAGDLFITKDTGTTWQQHGHFPGASTFAISDSTGIIPSTDGSIYLSTDNGNTWQKTKDSLGIMAPWCDIVSRDTLFLLKYNPNEFITALYKSANRGNDWQLVNNNIDQFNIPYTDFITSRRGFAIRPGSIHKTEDGGATWQTTNYPNSTNVICLKFYDTLRACGYADGGGMIKTVDGGKTWTVFPQTASRINNIFFIDANHAYAVGEDGALFKTENGGDTWVWVAFDPLYGYSLYTQYFFTADKGIVAGLLGKIFSTRDGGSNWKAQAPTYTDITGISFPSVDTGYATTWNNIYQTTDTGNTWKELSFSLTPNQTTRFDNCRFRSKDTGFVTVNAPVRMYKTMDGGQNWSPLNPFPVLPQPYDNITDLNFINRDTGFASLHSTSFHAVFKTTDAGDTWNEIGNQLYFDKLFFVNSQLGYATKYHLFYRTTDGGTNWTNLPPTDFMQINSLWFNNASTGFLAYDQGNLKMTVDSGATWTDIILDPFELPKYRTLKFYNKKIGYITTENGSIYKTVDSGYHWRNAGTIGALDAKSIIFQPDTTVIFAGLWGAIVQADIAEYNIDSLSVLADVCGARFKAKVSSFLSPVDSIWFVYGKRNYTDSVRTNPVSLIDTAINLISDINGLQADSVYRVKVKVLFKGNFYYSKELVFIPRKTARPVITAAGNVLSSSYAGSNQWYLNGVLIPGATSQQYTAVASGTYTVIASADDCPSAASADYALTVTATPDIVLNGEIAIYPNPVFSGDIQINTPNNNRRLSLQINDINGRNIHSQGLKTGINTISLNTLPKGIYIFIITDIRTKQWTNRKVLKL